MDEVVILALLVTTAGLAVVAARGILAFIFRVMTHPPLLEIQWRLVTFVVALFWFWYLAPTVAAHLR
jgi:hypothetical protein